MADNPFANPFEDPAVKQATNKPAPNAPAEYNPFAGQNIPSQPQQPARPVAPPAAAAPPPIINAAPAAAVARDIPPAYTPAAQTTAAAATDDLRRKQEELERKEAELRERERQLHNQAYPNRANNWPPLPKAAPCTPCFYQDFSVDIPVEFQRVVRHTYFIWIIHCVVHMYNMVAAFAAMVSGSDAIEDGGTLFGLSLLWFVVFTPCSFLCWYRPLYKAFRSDSSFNFFMFFFVYFFQFLVHAVEAIGFNAVGACGWINSITVTGHGWIFVGILMFVAAAAFTLLAIIDFLMLVKVHRIFRGGQTQFTLQSAQEEFAHGVMSNQAVRGAAASAATSAAYGAASAATAAPAK